MELEEGSSRQMKRLYISAGIAALVLLVSGWGYRVLAERLNISSGIKVMPEIPFKYFPMYIDGWEGKDQPISETVLKVAANDDYVCRVYHNPLKHLNASLYIAYTCEPYRMLGHRPQVCYAGSGWTHMGTETKTLMKLRGEAIEVLIHYFQKGGLSEKRLAVVNYYIVNGLITTEHGCFSGLRWRRARMQGNQADYVAQVQISAGSTESACALAQSLYEQILFHLPKSEKTNGPRQEPQAVH